MTFRHERHVDITGGDRVAFQWRRRLGDDELTWTGVIRSQKFQGGVCVEYVVYVDAPQHGVDRATLDDGNRRPCFVALQPEAIRLVERGQTGRILEGTR